MEAPFYIRSMNLCMVYNRAQLANVGEYMHSMTYAAASWRKEAEKRVHTKLEHFFNQFIRPTLAAPAGFFNHGTKEGE